jgi:hypothetical protein
VCYSARDEQRLDEQPSFNRQDSQEACYQDDSNCPLDHIGMPDHLNRLLSEPRYCWLDPTIPTPIDAQRFFLT